MRTYTDQVARALEKGLAPVWLIAGDEPLLTGEAADLVRARARKEGFTGRDLFVTDRSFDWSEVTTASRALSLFSERRILEIRMPYCAAGQGGRRRARGARGGSRAGQPRARHHDQAGKGSLVECLAQGVREARRLRAVHAGRDRKAPAVDFSSARRRPASPSIAARRSSSPSASRATCSPRSRKSRSSHS